MTSNTDRSDSDIAWAAGLFEGEGSVCNSRIDGRVVGIKVCINTYTDYDVLVRFHNIVGVGSIIGPYQRTTLDGRPQKPCWGWNIGAFEDCQLVLTMFWPWLGARRKTKAEECMAEYSRRSVQIKGTGRGKLKGKKEEILKLRAAGVRQCDIAKKFNVSRSIINVICSQRAAA